jgi:hypothetical protein
MLKQLVIVHGVALGLQLPKEIEFWSDETYMRQTNEPSCAWKPQDVTPPLSGLAS